MNASAYLPDGMARGIRFVRQELAPFPWRINLALRCVLASAIVIVASMTLEVPALALSLLAVFYTTQSNVVITRLAGILFMVASTLAVGIALVLLIFTFDHPLLRIVGASLVLFISAYLMRILKVGTIFFVVAIVVIYVQSLVDQIPVPDLMVRLALWVVVVVNYAILVSMIVNTLLLPIEPAQQLKEEMHRQLTQAGAALLRLEQGAGRIQAPGPAQVLAGMLTLQKLLKFAAMRDKQCRADEAYQLALIASVSALARAASELPAAIDAPGPLLAASVRQLRTECAALDSAVQAGTRYRLAAAAPEPAAAPIGGIGAMWRTLSALSAFGIQPTPSEKEGRHEEPMVASDALTNPAYVRFALKVVLAVMSGYVFYNAVDWQGIHTIMLTCLIVALPSLGASTRQALLRVGGALVGSALALFMIVFVIPRIDSVTGLLLMALPVIGLGAWVAGGSERISYAGIQIMFTFALAVLERFGPTTNLTEIRDRMVGILLGVMLAVAVQTLVWPEGEGDALRRKLAGLMRSVARLMQSDVPALAGAEQMTYVQQEVRTWTEFGTTQAMLARVAIEPDWYENANELVTARSQAVLASAQQIIRGSEALHDQLAIEEPAPQVRSAVDAVRAAVADELERYAAALQADPPSAKQPASMSAAMFGLPAQAPAPVARAAEDLVRHLGGLPDWTEPAPGPVPVRAPIRP
jgi:multidrug resistance protein MdtO